MAGVPQGSDSTTGSVLCPTTSPAPPARVPLAILQRSTSGHRVLRSRPRALLVAAVGVMTVVSTLCAMPAHAVPCLTPDGVGWPAMPRLDTNVPCTGLHGNTCVPWGANSDGAPATPNTAAVSAHGRVGVTEALPPLPVPVGRAPGQSSPVAVPVSAHGVHASHAPVSAHGGSVPLASGLADTPVGCAPGGVASTRVPVSAHGGLVRVSGRALRARGRAPGAKHAVSVIGPPVSAHGVRSESMPLASIHPAAVSVSAHGSVPERGARDVSPLLGCARDVMVAVAPESPPVRDLPLPPPQVATKVVAGRRRRAYPIISAIAAAPAVAEVVHTAHPFRRSRSCEGRTSGSAVIASGLRAVPVSGAVPGMPVEPATARYERCFDLRSEATASARHSADPAAAVLGKFAARAASCQWCGESLLWRPFKYFTTCKTCRLSVVVSPTRVLPPAVAPDTGAALHDGGWGALCPVGSNASDVVLSRPPLDVADFRWDTVRQHPVVAEAVVVCRFEQPIAVLHRRLAAWLRHLFLSRWSSRWPMVPVNEYDVAAHIVEFVLGTDPTQWSVPDGPFSGQDVMFMPWSLPSEPGLYRPASLPHGAVTPVFDPATSAFVQVEQFGSPLVAAEYRARAEWHPMADWFANSVGVGFSLLSWTPRGERDSVRTHSSSSDGFAAAVAAEFTHGAFRHWPEGAPTDNVRRAPFLDVPKHDGTRRGVSDMSRGEFSVNECTQRASHSRARLAKLHRVQERITYMKQQRPHDPVLMAKFDVSRGYRQVPIPVRDFHRAVHSIDGRDVFNTRLMMGAASSGDSMSQGVTIIRDELAMMHGVFSESYCDDHLILMYESEKDRVMTLAVGLWNAFGWPMNPKKFASEGLPSTQKVFLGILFDTEAMTLAMDDDRVSRIRETMSTWLRADASALPSPREISSMAGKLCFVSTVVPCGRVFIRSLFRHGYHTQSRADRRAGRQPLSALPDDLRADLVWWHESLAAVNGIMSAWAAHYQELHVSTDASSFGGGAVLNDLSEYIAWEWEAVEREHSSTAHWELAAIVLAVCTWGPRIAGGVLVVHTDSMACVHVVNRQRCSEPRMYLLLRLLALMQITYRCRVVAEHIPGEINHYPDALSRGRWPAWPQGSPSPTRRAVPYLTRLLGGILRWQRLWLASPGATTILLVCNILPSIVPRPVTPCLPTLPSIRWRPRETHSSRMGDCSTSSVGCSTRTRDYWRLISADMLDLSARTAIPGWAGSLSIRRCCPPSCDVGASALVSGSTATQRPVNSFQLCTTMNRSTLAYAQRWWWGGMACCGSVSTPPRRGGTLAWTLRCYDLTTGSGPPPMAVASGSDSSGPSPTPPTSRSGTTSDGSLVMICALCAPWNGISVRLQ